MVERKCLVCGKVFQTYSSQDKKFCNRKCHYQWMKGRKNPKHSEWMKNHNFFKGKTRERAWNWKGGRTIKRARGYVFIYKPEHPRANSNGYIAEHRLVMEKYLGRYLEPWEYIHHKNGRPNDNHLKNLQLLYHKGRHFGQVRCPYCLKEFLIK